ncbi:MAG: alpha-2-macroglobulin family protein, partial [Acetobacteraceae bacterium]
MRRRCQGPIPFLPVRLIAVWLIALAILCPIPARAAAPPDAAAARQTQVFIDRTLPGLGADANRLRFDLTRRTLALSATRQAQRAAAEAVLHKAEAAQDWETLRTAAETRIGLGAARDPALWLAYGTALLHLPDGSAKTALAAGYLAFTYRQNGSSEPDTARAALGMMRAALDRLGDHLAEIKLLGEIVQAYPGDQADQALLARQVARYGFVVRKIDTTPDTFPARACVAFTVPLPRDGALHPGDYVTIAPPRKSLAVTEEQGKLCLAGLPPGTTTTVTLRPGLPGVAGARLAAPLDFKITMADRKPALIADPTHYIIAASNPPAIGFASVNLSKVKIVIARVAERSLRGFLANHPLLNSGGSQSSLEGGNSAIVFTGAAAVPDFVRNQLMHTVLPLADVMKTPGLYAVSLAPDDGTPDPDDRMSLVQTVLRTDIAPTTWRGADGLYVQLRRFTSAAPIAAASLDLIAADNAILGTAKTDAAGMAHFAAPLLAGVAGQAPAALHITGPDGDFTLVDLTATPFDLADRGVSGQPEPKPIDPYLWLDRGIYRPGETIHLGALLRSPDGKPLDVPLHLIVRRPGGQIFSDTVPHWINDRSLVLPIVLSSGAQAGRWTVALALDDKAPPLAVQHFTVAAFVPARLAVTFGKPAVLTPGTVNPWPVSVRFLYGAPGANLTGTASLRITPDPTPFATFAAYRFGLHDEIFASPLARPKLPETDAAGHSAVPIDLTRLPDSTHALQAKLTVTIDDPSGRAVSRTTTLPIRPTGDLIGIKPDFTGGAVDQGAQPAFDIVAVGPDGKPAALQADLSLVRQDPEWGVIWNSNVARWRFTYIDRPVLQRTVSIEPGAPLHLALPALPYGRYRLRLIQHDGGLAATSTIFYSGWVTSANPGVPTRLTVARDRRRYDAGAVAHLHITAPYAGPATLVIASDRVISTRNFILPKGGTDLAVPVSADWGAGAYAIVHVFRPAAVNQPPDRAIGLAWLGLTPGARALPVTLAVQPLYRPGRDVAFTVNTEPGAYVTLDAVDEGILRLTDFKSPVPLAHFFGKRTLGVDIADPYAALLRPPSGAATALRVGGGGDFGAAQAPIPQQLVSLFAGPVQAGADGVAKFTLHIPDFNGQIRLMAVGWKGSAVGAASRDIITRHKVIADILLPRFLAPGDHADIGLMLQNLDLPAGLFHVQLAATGAVSGQAQANLDLAPGARHLLPVPLVADAVGTGHVSLMVTGPGGYAQHRERDISVHVVAAPETRLSAVTIAPGARRTLTPDLTPFVAGSAHATVTFGNHLPFDPAAYLQALDTIRYRFLEASVSRGLPLTALTGTAAGADPAGRLASAIEAVLDDQRYDGAFGLWSSQDDAQPWLTAYATEFLLRARKAGARVPGPPLEAALDWLRREVANDPSADQSAIYAAYVLALDGRAPAGTIRVMDADLAAVAHPLARAQLGAALALIGE